MKALVIGHKGSIGARHARNLKSLGVEVIGCDLGDTPTHLVDFAVISSPTSTHLFWIRWCEMHSLPFFCEKPVCGSSHDLGHLEQIELSVPNMVACNLRYSPSMDVIRQFCLQNKVISFHARVSDSNPARAKYREGLALQDIHEFDYLSHLFGDILEMDILENDNRDSYESFIRFKSGLWGTVHGDRVCDIYHRGLTLTSKSRTLYIPIDVSPVMYVSEMEDFVNRLRAGDQMPNTVKQALSLTRMICEEYEFAHA